MDIQTCLTNAKLVSSTQVDLSYFNLIAGQVFPDAQVYANVQSDVQFINQIGSTLFNYFNQKDPVTQKIWYDALRTGLTTAIADATSLIALIPSTNPHATELATVLQILIADCQAIQHVIPVTKAK